MPIFRRVRRFRLFLQKLLKITNAPVNEYLLNDLLAQDQTQTRLAERINWIEQVLLWVFQGPKEQADARIRFLLRQLEKNPGWESNFKAVVTVLLRECNFWDFFNHVGLAVERGLWGDLSDRLMARLIPRGGTANFKEILLSVFIDDIQLEQLRFLSESTLERVYQLIYQPENAEAWRARRQEAREARLALAVHVAHHGLSSRIRKGLSWAATIDNPFVLLLTCFEKGRDGEVPARLEACRRAVEEIHTGMEDRGVSVDVVNRLETISALLNRIEILGRVTRAETRREEIRSAQELLASAIEAGMRGRSLVDYVRHHFYLLSRKISERNGQSAEHYIARTSEETRQLFFSAIGGGAIVVAMAACKLGLVQLRPAPLFLAMAIWIVYASGFLAMQFLGFTLATKIPSFTASRLATLLGSIRRHNSHAFRSEFRLTLKSQAVALFGNVIGLSLLVPLVAYLWQLALPNFPIVTIQYAHHLIEDLNPFLSWAVPLGALTGIQLWLSSLAGGWFENWIVYHRVPQAIESHLRITRLLGEPLAKRFANWIRTHASGIATNVSLGFLFGFTPLLGALFRANWNGHHVTISSATTLYAAAASSYTVDQNEAWFAVLGLLMIAVMNFSISFGLALYVAANSQKIHFSRVLYYLQASILRSS